MDMASLESEGFEIPTGRDFRGGLGETPRNNSRAGERVEYVGCKQTR